MDFNSAFDRVIGHEGGYVNNPKDPGGETKYGITIDVARSEGYTGNMRDLTREQAKEIYRKAYWGKIKADQYPGAIAYQVFDTAVNHGISQAIRFLQRAVGVIDDANLGPVTIAAIKAMPVNDVMARFNAERLNFYTNLPTWASFGKGWVRRVAVNLKYAAEDTAN